MPSLKSFNKGVSLPLVIGLVSLLMVASVAVNELILRALRSAHNVEAADRAYFTAEAGIEDALYELSAHFAGYETPDLGVAGPLPSRLGDFRNTVKDVAWNNNWTIRSHNANPADPITGKFYPKQKLSISLFNDTSGSASVLPPVSVPPSPQMDAINDVAPSISTLNPPFFRITLKIPKEIVNSNSDAFTSNVYEPGSGLVIDNDNDGQVNEDGPNDTHPGACTGGGGATFQVKDADCDGREDEDSAETPIIYWKITDGGSKSLTPLTGCIGDAPTNPTDPDYENSEICEKNFTFSGNDLIATLDSANKGLRENGVIQQIGEALTEFSNPGNQQQLVFEFLIVSPLEQAYQADGLLKKIPIPYLDYQVDTPDPTDVPLPLFTIKSDGYYQNFKQSITTIVTPKTSAPLFDFTIIQQQ